MGGVRIINCLKLRDVIYERPLHENNFLFQSGVPSRPGGNNFELETDNDNWPEVDLGNLIFDLDADIDKTTTTTTTMSSTNTTSATGSGRLLMLLGLTLNDNWVR